MFDRVRLMTAVFAGSAFLYVWGWRSLRRRWFIENLPTSKARSVAMGLAELKGKAKYADENPLLSPVQGLPCVWYRVVVERHATHNSKRSSRVLLRREVGVPFYLEDDTGRVKVLPDGAEIHGVEVCNTIISGNIPPTDDLKRFCDLNAIRWQFLPSDIDVRVKEYAVLADADVYVLGDAVAAANPTEDRRRRVSAILREWLKMPERKAELDKNRDGMIQPEEWDAARAEAQSLALKEETAVRGPEGPEVVIRKPRFGYFLIVSGDEEDAIKSQGYPGLCLIGGLALFAAGVWMAPGVSLDNPFVWAGAVIGGILAFDLLRRVPR